VLLVGLAIVLKLLLVGVAEEMPRSLLVAVAVESLDSLFMGDVDEVELRMLLEWVVAGALSSVADEDAGMVGADEG
jgi:hypothetical protein